MSDFPGSLIEFQQRFSDETGVRQVSLCGALAAGLRLSSGCGTSKAWELQTKPWTWECASCGRQTSVTAGTIIHHSKPPLTTWFWAAYLMATHSNGISALQLQRQLGLGSYRSAWLLCGKLRHSMVAPCRTALALPASNTTPTSLVRWPPTSSCPGCTASSRTSRSGRWVSTTACAASICNPTSTSSSFASTAAGPGTPRSAPCSVSLRATDPSPTTC